MKLKNKIAYSFISSFSITALFFIFLLNLLTTKLSVPYSWYYFFSGIFVLSFIVTFIIIQALSNSLKSTEKETNDNEIELLKANEKYRKEFLGNVSHELKTPLFNIQGYLLTLLDGGINDKNINIKYLKRAEKNVNRMISVIEDLLTISKLETQELKVKKTSFDIINLIYDVFEYYEIKKTENMIDLRLKTVNDKLFVHADKEHITVIISNLVSNSIKYGKTGGVSEVSLTENEKTITVSVQDNGIGIAEKDQDRIFERFYRVDKSRSKELGGTGLGLSIVKHILDAHNKKVKVISKPGVGTKFIFELDKAEI